MATVWAILFILLLVCILMLHVFSLPANWVVLALLLIWKLAHPEVMGWGFMALMASFALTGELIEFIAQAYGARRFGSTGKGNIGGIIGAIAGAIIGAPFFFGLGAVAGALAGAYLGCFILEAGQGRSNAEASRAAWGAFWGKFFGMGIKVGFGMAMLALSIPLIWP